MVVAAVRSRVVSGQQTLQQRLLGCVRPSILRPLSRTSVSRGYMRSLCSAHTIAAKPYRAYLLDMDGVLHQFGKPVRGAKEFLDHLLLEDVPFIVVTNEDRYTNAALQAKLEHILEVRVPISQIYTCANSVGDFFVNHVDKSWNGNVFAIGEAGLHESISSGLELRPGSRLLTPSESEDAHCDYVCVGTVFTGGKNDTMIGAERASNFLRKGAKLLYSNPDWFEVTADGSYKFGCPMPVVNLLQHTTGCSAYNLGKPNPFMLRQAHKKLLNAVLSSLSESRRRLVEGNIPLDEVLFVGDSINTDVRIAIENGIDAACVLSGTTTADKLKLSAIQPNYVFETIQELNVALQEGSLLCGGRNHAA